jgi:hypothetical protein
MAFCPGKKIKTKGTCNGTLYRCKKCGNVGCDQGPSTACSNQAFDLGKCMKCGARGHKERFS